jgi:type IV secretion system protein TrbH
MSALMRLFNLTVVLLLSSCAFLSPQGSYVDAVQPKEATLLASSMADFLGQQLPPAKTTLVLIPLPGSQAKNTLTSALTLALVRAGYGMASLAAAPTEAHRIRYLVSSMKTGVLVRIQYDQTEAACWFIRNRQHQLYAGLPFTVRSKP